MPCLPTTKREAAALQSTVQAVSAYSKKLRPGGGRQNTYSGINIIFHLPHHSISILHTLPVLGEQQNNRSAVLFRLSLPMAENGALAKTNTLNGGCLLLERIYNANARTQILIYV